MSETPQQMGLDGILDAKPIDKASAVKVEKSETASTETVDKEEKPSAAPVERNHPTRRDHRDKEQAAHGRIRDPETGQYVPKPETKVEELAKPAAEKTTEIAKPAAAPQDELTPKERAAFAKAADETRKRQAMERELVELRAKVNPQEPAKTFWDDPEGAMRRQNEQVQQAIIGTRLQTSETIARSRHQDFEEKVAIFSEIAQSTPGLAQQMLASADPAEFVYRTAANHKALQDAGGLDEMRKKIEAETTAKVRTQLEAELKDKAEALARERAALPGSLTDAPSKGNGKIVWGGPTSLDGILGGK